MDYALEIAEDIALRPSAMQKSEYQWMRSDCRPRDMRGERGPDWNYWLRIPYYISGPFAGQYLKSGGCIVCSTDAIDPAPPIIEQPTAIEHRRGRFICPHCEGKYRLALPLVTHLRDVHRDGITANLMHSIWQERPDARKPARRTKPIESKSPPTSDAPIRADGASIEFRNNRFFCTCGQEFSWRSDAWVISHLVRKHGVKPENAKRMPMHARYLYELSRTEAGR